MAILTFVPYFEYIEHAYLDLFVLMRIPNMPINRFDLRALIRMLNVPILSFECAYLDLVP